MPKPLVVRKRAVRDSGVVLGMSEVGPANSLLPCPSHPPAPASEDENVRLGALTLLTASQVS